MWARPIGFSQNFTGHRASLVMLTVPQRARQFPGGEIILLPRAPQEPEPCGPVIQHNGVSSGAQSATGNEHLRRQRISKDLSVR